MPIRQAAKLDANHIFDIKIWGGHNNRATIMRLFAFRPFDHWGTINGPRHKNDDTKCHKIAGTRQKRRFQESKD